MTPEAQKIEAVLFLAGEMVLYEELGRLIDRPSNEVEQFVEEATLSLAGHGLSLLKTDTGVQLVTSSDVAGFLKRFIEDEAQELSCAAAETLALVAYRGPISRVDIDAIRGVDSRRMLRQLVLRGLVEKRGDGKKPEYTISEGFLQNMGINSVVELPEYDTLSSHEKLMSVLGKDDLNNV